MESIKRRKMLQAIAATFGGALLSSCGCGGGDGGSYYPPPPPPPPPPPKDCLWVYPDPADMRVVGGLLDNSGQFVLSGMKSSDGNIQSAHQLLVFDPAGNITTVEFIPADVKIVATGDNVQASVCSMGSGAWGIGLSAADQQLSLVVPAQAGAAQTSNDASVRAGRAAELALRPGECGSCAVATPAPAGSAEIAVTGCLGANGGVFAKVSDEAGKLLDVAIASALGDNKFAAMPVHPDTGADALAKAKNQVAAFLPALDSAEAAFSGLVGAMKKASPQGIADQVVDFLSLQNQLGAVVGRFATAAGLTAEDVTDTQKAAKFSAFLAKALGLAFKAVTVADTLAQAVQAGNLMSSLGNAYTQPRPRQLRLQAVARSSTGTSFLGTTSEALQPAGPYPTLALSTTGSIQISAMALSPQVPAATQDYVAAGEIACLAAGDEVTVSVAGADGYTSSASATASEGTLAFSVGVPGGAGGVRDAITLQVRRGGSLVAGKTASLVFS